MRVVVCILTLLLQVAEAGVAQLPHVMRIIRQPDAVNEAFSFRYQLRPWPLGHVPQTALVSIDRASLTTLCQVDLNNL